MAGRSRGFSRNPRVAISVCGQMLLWCREPQHHHISSAFCSASYVQAGDKNGLREELATWDTEGGGDAGDERFVEKYHT